MHPSDGDHAPKDLPAALRARAETALAEQAPDEPGAPGLDAAEVRRMLHELRVHQIELEMQNEELRRAKDELEISLERWFELYELAPVGYCTLSEEGFILQSNLAVGNLLGVPRSALVQRHFVGFVEPSDQNAFRNLRVRLLDTGEPQSCELRMAVPSGAVRWVQLSASVAQDREGVRALRVVLVDATAQRQAEAAEAALRLAEQTGRMRHEFLSRVSHEFRTPLNAILGFSSLLQIGEGSMPPWRAHGYVQHIHDAGKHLLHLVEDVLDISRSTSGVLTLTPVDMDVLAALRNAVLAVEADARARTVEISIAEPIEMEMTATVRADPTRLRQVLLNLLSNAVKYNRPGGHLRIRVLRHGNGWRLCFADDGIGMTPAQLAALFQPFNRLGREAEGIQGTGLGLVIARDLVQAMGGDLTVRSEPGAGSEFLVDLPAGLAVPRAAEGAVPGALQVRADITGRVLCVEDDGAARALIASILELRPGLALELVANGKGGIEAARRAWPDLLILDQRLPDMAGLDALKVLRQSHADRTLRCLVVSAEAMPADIERARSAGADDYLTKPIDAVGLLSRIDALLGANPTSH